MASKDERDEGSDEEEGVEDKSKNAKAQQAALKTLNRDDDAGKAVDNAQAAKVRPPRRLPPLTRPRRCPPSLPRR